MPLFKRKNLEASSTNYQQVRLMTLSDLNASLKEALLTDSVGCSESTLFDISQATYHLPFMTRIMKSAWSCIKSRASKYRRIQKALTLLSYLAINGSEACINDIVTHLDHINSIHRLKFPEANKEVGILIKEKAVQLTALVCDLESLMSKRKYAASIRDRFISVGSSNGRVEVERLHKPVFVLDSKSNVVPHNNQMFLGGMAGTQRKYFPSQEHNAGDGYISNFFKNALHISSKKKATQREIFESITANSGVYENMNTRYNLKDNIFDTPSTMVTSGQKKSYGSNYSDSSSSPPPSSSSQSSSSGHRSYSRSRSSSKTQNVRSYSKSPSRERYNKKDRRTPTYSSRSSSSESVESDSDSSYDSRRRSISSREQYSNKYQTRNTQYDYNNKRYNSEYYGRNDYYDTGHHYRNDDRYNSEYSRSRTSSNPFR